MVVADRNWADLHHAANHGAVSDSYMEGTWDTIETIKEINTETIIFCTYSCSLAVFVSTNTQESDVFIISLRSGACRMFAYK